MANLGMTTGAVEEKAIVLEIDYLVALHALIPDMAAPLHPSDPPRILGHRPTARDHEVDLLTLLDVAREAHLSEEVIEGLLAMVVVHDRRLQEGFPLVEKAEEVLRDSQGDPLLPLLWRHDGPLFRVVEVLG